MEPLRQEFTPEDATLMFLALGIYDQVHGTKAEDEQGRVLRLMDLLGRACTLPSRANHFMLEDLLTLLRALVLTTVSIHHGAVVLKEETGRDVSAGMASDAKQLAGRLAGLLGTPQLVSQLTRWAEQLLAEIVTRKHASHTA
ncbi:MULTISPECIES: hypothetical protein [Deinococcus]|uniref:Uncharacterized protein n=2 Tax=Deinococcus TaxID=1298 RepID=F0RQJ5_DEIPM|nr:MULTISPECIES: hypothetical protein [Deinococcus]ADY27554.1 hypothetical protein Deipr_2436 [Deinococcus proteolyticus MRP]RTR26347.1 hypothetical protein EJ104_08365 [Deinococcus radiophilus]UFA52008.1 hypothetical protein LMT64_13525 [Deinococcus radiophilus]